MDEVMRFDEQQGGIEHDLGELLHVAIPGYPDATEYRGLMVFEEITIGAPVLRGEVSDPTALATAPRI